MKGLVAVLAVASACHTPRYRCDLQTLGGEAQVAIRFAGVAEGARVLGSADGFTEGLTPYDLAVRERTSSRAYRLHAAGQAREWSPREQRRWQCPMQAVAAAAGTLDVQLPSEIVLVRTSSDVEFGFPHTRSNAIVLPGGAGHHRRRRTALLAHETFHVLTRHDAAAADRAYAVLGFYRLKEDISGSIDEARAVSNPDALSRTHAIVLQTDGAPVHGVPVLRGRNDADVAVRRSMSSNLTFDLVEVDANTHRPTGVVFAVEDTDYRARVGKNTGYILHPEEAMADNFSLAVLQVLGQSVVLDHPEVVQQTREAVKRR